MRGDQEPQAPVFATVVLEDWIPADHPLRAVRGLVNRILRKLSLHSHEHIQLPAAKSARGHHLSPEPLS
jgi:hypothetical protein